MTLERPTPDVERRDRGLALADALLEGNRPLAPLPEVAHARVKRQLKASLRRSAARWPRWLQPVLISSVMLLCGAASGIALDRLVLQRSSVMPGEVRSPAPTAKPNFRRGKLKVPVPGTTGAEPTQDEALPVAEPPGPGVAPSVGASASSVQAPVRGAPSSAAASAFRVESPVPVPTRGTGGLPKLAMRSETARVSRATEPVAMPAELPPAAPAAAPVVSAPVVAPVETAAPAPAKVTPAVVDGLTEERLLAAALRALRAQRDPPSALLALDEYRGRFPHGRLAVEADVLRVDSLVALHRNGEALATLDRMELGHVPGGLERQLQRGELRALVGRWRDAQSDFDRVLAHAGGLTHDLSERALWGRAQSRARLGDKPGARADVDEYLRRFPKGRFAAQAERLMGADDPSTR